MCNIGKQIVYGYGLLRPSDRSDPNPIPSRLLSTTITVRREGGFSLPLRSQNLLVLFRKCDLGSIRLTLAPFRK